MITRPSRATGRLAIIVALPNGLETFVRSEITVLAGRGLPLRLYATPGRLLAGFEPPSGVPIQRFSFTRALLGPISAFFRHPLRTLRALQEAIRLSAFPECVLGLSWLKQMMADDAPGVHASFGDRKFFAAYFAARYLNRPLSVTLHAHELYAQPNELMFRRALSRTSLVTTISETNAEIVRRRYPEVADKTVVVRIPIDIDYWRRDFAVVCLTVARYTERKGYRELVRAAAILGPEFHFVTVGDGSLDVAALAEEYGCSDHFTVLGKQTPHAVRLLYRSADVFVLLSKHTADEGSEGIPVALMEAIAMGLPVVTTSDGSIPELVTEAMVDPTDAPKVAEEIRRAFEERGCGPRGREQQRRLQTLHGVANWSQMETLLRKVHNINGARLETS